MIVFQNSLLSVILLRFKSLKCCRFFCRNNSTHSCGAEHIQACFLQFEVQKYITKLRSSHDCLVKLCIHSVFKFLRFALMYLFLTGTCLPNTQRNLE